MTSEDTVTDPTTTRAATASFTPDDVRTVGAPVDGRVPDVPAEQAWDDRRLHYRSWHRPTGASSP